MLTWRASSAWCAAWSCEWAWAGLASEQWRQHACLWKRRNVSPANQWSIQVKEKLFTRELLLQFTHKARLDLLERAKLRHRDEDDDCLLAANVHLLCSRNVQLTELCLQVGVQLQIQKGMGDRVLKLVRLFSGRLDDFGRGQHDLVKKMSRKKTHVKAGLSEGNRLFWRFEKRYFLVQIYTNLPDFNLK